MSQHKFLKDICAFWGLTAFAVLLTLFAFSDAYAATIEVTPGTFSQATIDGAVAGDIINFASGTYTTNINIESFSGLTLNGENQATTIIKPDSTLDWDALGHTNDRKVGTRIVDSTDIIIDNLTFDFDDMPKSSNVVGIMYADSTGQITNNIMKNLAVLTNDGNEFMVRMESTSAFDDSNRMAVLVQGNTLIDSGRIGIYANNFVDATISNNNISKTAQDFGYGIELVKRASGTITNNVISGFDKVASDTSISAGIYFVSNVSAADQLTPLTVTATINNNEVSNSAYGLYIGTRWCNLDPTDIDLNAIITNNNLHDNTISGIRIAACNADEGQSITVNANNNVITNNDQFGYFIANGELNGVTNGKIIVSINGDEISGQGKDGVRIQEVTPLKLIDSSFSFDNLQVSDNVNNGIIITGDQTTSPDTKIDVDFSVTNSAFENNGAFPASSSNPADLEIFLFEGNSLVENVTILKSAFGVSGTNQNSYGIEYRGLTCTSDGLPTSVSGTNTLNNISILGTPNKEGLLIQCYSDVSGFSLNDVDLSNVVTDLTSFWPTSLVVVHSGIAPLNVGNLKTQEIRLTNTGGIDAEQAQFFDSSVNQITDNFEIEDVVEHALDADGLGLVTWVPGNLYVTQSSGSIQRGINNAESGDNVNVGSGIYETGAILLEKPLSLISDTGDYRTTSTILSGHSEFRLQGNDADQITIKGFQFEDITGTTFQATIHSNPSVGQSNDDILIEKNSFINLLKHAVKTNANNDNFIINDNKVTNVGNGAVPTMSGFQIFFLQNGKITNNIIDTTTFAGMNLDTMTNSIISGNTINNVVANGIQVANSPNSNSVISDNTITNANNDNSGNEAGITVWSNSNDLTIQNNILKNNHNGILACVGPCGFPPGPANESDDPLLPDVVFIDNQIFDNTGLAAVNLDQSGGILTALNNYWGHATGPTHSSNTKGKGDTVSDNVTFDPWYINAKKTNLSKDVTVTNSEIASANNNVKLDSDSSTDSTAGQAVLPTDIDTIILSDTTVLDLVVNLQQATGAEENLIKISGVDKDLKAFKIKDKVGVEVEFDLKSNKPSIGDKIVNIKKAVKLNSGIANQPIILKNSDFASATISIPDATTILAPDGWDGTIQPPKTGSSAGTAPSGFSVGGTVIEVGSPDVVLLFDTAVDVLLSGVTGNVGYKPAGSDTWVQITDTCGGTFASSDSPTFPGECFISDGTDTKIVTFHFTEFGSLNVKSGSGCVDCIKPVLQSNSLSSPDSNIFEGILKLDDSARNSASLFETGDTIDFELSFYEDRGAESLNHVALFTNIRGFDDRYDSNLYVEWDKGKPLKVYDPEGYLDDITNVSFAEHDTDVVMTFHLNFVKPMDVSHIVLYYWDYFRNSGLVTFEDAIVIIEPVEDVIAEFQTDEIIANDDTVNDSIDTSKKEESPVIPAWIKDNAGRWADGTLEDFTFTNGIQYLIQEKIIDVPTSPNVSVDPDDEIIEEEEEQEIPKWIKNSAKWWSEDMISEEEFVNAIQWLIANGVVVI